MARPACTKNHEKLMYAITIRSLNAKRANMTNRNLLVKPKANGKMMGHPIVICALIAFDLLSSYDT